MWVSVENFDQFFFFSFVLASRYFLIEHIPRHKPGHELHTQILVFVFEQENKRTHSRSFLATAASKFFNTTASR